MGRKDRRAAAGAHPSFLAKSIEQLERADWGAPTYGSYVVTTVHVLRRMPLDALGDEHLRLALSQQVGLPWVAELAVIRLEEDPFRAGDFGPGDVLRAALRLPAEAWRGRPDLKDRLGRLASQAMTTIEALTLPIRDDIDEALGRFQG